MRILLINPDLADGRGYLSYNDGRFKRLLVNPSMTMPYIASLTPHEHEVIICDEMLGDCIDFDQDVDLVGITVVTQLAKRAYQIASAFRQRGPKVVLGGAHITLMPEEALEFAEAVVVGEAEDVWPQLLVDLQEDQLKPVYRRTRLHHLGGLPTPRMDLLNKQYRYLGVSMGQVKISRGCPYACVTCCVPALYGSRYRFRPLDEVLREIEGIAEDVIYFCEDNIVGNPRYAKELFRRMIPLNKQWTSISSIAIADDPELPASLLGFDLTDGLKRLQGNKRLYRKLLLNFASDYKAVANEIRQALDAKDFDHAHSLVHNLKGLAGNLAATDLQGAAVNLEKLVKGVQKKTPPAKELNVKFSELDNALNKALESAQSLGVSADENVCKLSDEEISDIPAEFAQDITKRIRDAAEMEDVMTLNAIATEIKTHSDSCVPLSKQIVQMAEDFDLDGIQKLAKALDAC